MESTLETASPATGPVTFSHVFGQQCQLMEAGRSMLRGWQRLAPLCLLRLSSVVWNVRDFSAVIGRHIYCEVFRTHHEARCATGQGNDGPVCLSLSLSSLATQRMRRDLMVWPLFGGRCQS